MKLGAILINTAPGELVDEAALPFLMVCYLLAFIDQANVDMATLQMNADLALSSTVFAFGAAT